MKSTEFRGLVFQYTERNGVNHRFNKTNQLAGKDWLYSFLVRHKELSLRQPENIPFTRATAFNRINVGKFFDLDLNVDVTNTGPVFRQ